jgi:hypothetical protein
VCVGASVMSVQSEMADAKPIKSEVFHFQVRSPRFSRRRHGFLHCMRSETMSKLN